MATKNVSRNQGGKGGGAKKKGRNFRTPKGTISDTTRYMSGNGPARHNARTARNCGCNNAINHNRANRAQHEADRQAKAAIARKAARTVALPMAA